MIYEDNSRHKANVLFIKKNGQELDVDEFLKDEPWFLCRYNHETQKYELDETFQIGEGSEDLNFNDSEFEVIYSIRSKINYAFACMHNDEIVEAVLKEIFPHIKNVKMYPCNYSSNNYLRIWMDKYNFTLKDFILNDKYVVLNCTGDFYNEFESLYDNALIDWDNIEYCSEYEEE